jgi:hypothetical protein
MPISSARPQVTAPAMEPTPSTESTQDDIRIRTMQVRRLGLAVSGGALVWATGLVTVGATPDTELGIAIGDLSALPFQLGLFALLHVQLRTRATGTSRAAVALIQVERVLLALASLWTVLHGISYAASYAWRDDVWLALLDAFWPLSMLGMAIVGVKVALAGRWRGAARFWPLVAESWAVIIVPTFLLIGPGKVADLVGAGHLVLGYGGLGLLLALRPQLTGARD